MNSFLVEARVVVPMAMMMAVGILMRTAKVTDRPSMKTVDQIVTRISMPLLMFQNIYTTDFSEFAGVGYFLYSAVGLLLVFLFGITVLPKLMNEPSRAAAMGQALLRPNYILFGNAVAASIYGQGKFGTVMLLGAFAVPFFNALAVIILEFGRNAAASPGKIIRSILKNPIVQASLIALGMQYFHIRLPGMVEDVCFDLAALATPLSFFESGRQSGRGCHRKKPQTTGAGRCHPTGTDPRHFCRRCDPAWFPGTGAVRHFYAVRCPDRRVQLPDGSQHGC